MHVCHTVLVRGNHYQRKTMKDECSNVLIAVILGYLEFFIIFFSFFERLGIYFNPPKKGPSQRFFQEYGSAFHYFQIVGLKVGQFFTDQDGQWLVRTSVIGLMKDNMLCLEQS